MAVQYSNIDHLDIIDYHLFLPVRGRYLYCLIVMTIIVVMQINEQQQQHRFL